MSAKFKVVAGRFSRRPRDPLLWHKRTVADPPQHERSFFNALTLSRRNNALFRVVRPVMRVLYSGMGIPAGRRPGIGLVLKVWRLHLLDSHELGAALIQLSSGLIPKVECVLGADSSVWRQKRRGEFVCRKKTTVMTPVGFRL